MNDLLEAARIKFANRCRELRGVESCRPYWAPKFGLSERAIQDLEQGRCLPSRAMVVLLKAIELEPEFMADVARSVREDLKELEAARRASRGAVRPQ